jgi:membrane protease YdiL (CAAX protease family)
MRRAFFSQPSLDTPMNTEASSLPATPAVGSLPPQSRAYATAIGAAKWFAALGGFLFVPQIVFAVYVVFRAGGRMPPMMELIPPLWIFLVTAITALALARHDWRDDSSRLWASPSRSLGWLLLPVALGQLLGWVGKYVLAVPAEQMMVELGEALAVRPDWGLLASIALGAPLLEEAVFRGLAWRWLRPSGGRLLTIGLVSLVFVGLHAGQYGAFGLLIVAALALAFAAVRERTGSLLLCIAAHVLVNTVAMAQVLGWLPK